MNKQQGFTLIETFGAITILILAVLGPLSLLSANIADGAIVKNQATAAYLAQEGIELVINRRDENNEIGTQFETGATENSWLEGLDDCIGSTICNLEAPLDVGSVADAVACDGDPNKLDDACALVLVDQTRSGGNIVNGGFYQEYDSSDTKTIFRREIKIEPFNSVEPEEVDGKEFFWTTEGARVTVVMRWRFKSSVYNKKYVLSTVIYNPSLSSRSMGGTDLD